MDGLQLARITAACSYPLVESAVRLRKNNKIWDPLKNYFLSKNSVPEISRNCFEHELSLSYLGFVMNVCTIFQEAITKLQGNDVLVLDLYSIMVECKESLVSRRTSQFYGSIARSELMKCDNDNLIKKFKSDADTYLLICINYLEK